MNNSIRSKVVKESLLDYNALANSLKENTESAVKTLLDEAVRDTYAKLLSEDDSKDYEEEEVEDTSSDITNDSESSDASTDGVEDTDTSMEASDAESEEPNGEEPIETELEDGEGESEEWDDFDKYKMSDGEYDFTNAEDEQIVKVFKLMKNDDQILVNQQDNGMVNIQDNETGAEYLINLGGDNNVENVEVGTDDFGAEDDFENNDNDMNESTEKMFELVMEYNSNVGYTDNYQKKDVMTNPGMSEPGKNVNDWDAGVPKGTEKPWSGYPSKKNKADKPFNDGKGKQVEEAVEECGDGTQEEQVNELKTVEEHPANGLSTSRTDGPNNPRRHKGRSFHTAQNGQERGTGDNPYTNEALIKRMNGALKENKALKTALTDIMASLKEAAVTNHNLAQIIKLISENSTSQDEKKEIINRFMNEAKTIEASNALYESLSHDLKKSNKMNITEDKALTVEGSKKINETTIYKSPDVMESLDLMHRMMK